MEISLYGHLVEDTILYKDGTQNKTLGGIANVWKSIKTIDPSINVSVNPLWYGECLIHINKDTLEKTAKPYLNIHKNRLEQKKGKIAHFAYLDQLELDPGVFEKSHEIMVADICSNRQFDYTILRNFDIILASSKDLTDELINQAACYDNRIICHDKNNVICIHHRRAVKNFPNQHIIQKTNVLGAGDHFAASLLVSLYHGISEYDKIIPKAQKDTYNFLNEQV